MSTATAGQWVKFFNASGIPSPSAATYAHIFVENRIQNDMLLDLNKEYLREMGITMMGDIIAILRHAKHVSEQKARDKVLCSEISVPVAAIVANPVVPPDKKSTRILLKSSSLSANITNSSSKSSSAVVPILKQARRVLPEHEGKYKIKLPSGTTVRSKEILARKAKLYSDVEHADKPGVFERLDRNHRQRNSTDSIEDITELPRQDVKISFTGLGKTSITSSSIFSRLGGKNQDTITVPVERSLKPILKNSQRSSLSTIVKAKNSKSNALSSIKQQVHYVQNSIQSRETVNLSVDSSEDDITVTEPPFVATEKFVKFSSNNEVHEYTRPSPRPQYKNRKHALPRSGNGMTLRLADKMRATKKTIKLKPSLLQRELHVSPSKSARLKSDELLMRRDKSVHSRLGNLSNESHFTSSKAISNISNRIGKVYLSPSSLSRKNNNNQKGNNRSVFDRLGFND